MAAALTRPQHRSRGGGWAKCPPAAPAAFFNVGVFFGPPLFGYIVDATDSHPPAWWALAGSAAVALVLLLFVREGRGLEPGPRA